MKRIDQTGTLTPAISHAANADDVCEGVSRVVLIGNYPPRRCGIATFTADVYSALTEACPGLDCQVVAMNDPGGVYAYPAEVVATIRQEEPADYIAVGRRIEALRPDAVCVQHEYGIFGGPAGDRLLELLAQTSAPVVVTLHTVLTDPNDDQRRVIERLAARAAKLVVMAEKGRLLLETVFGVAPEKIAVVPHGAPDRPLTDTALAKPKFGLDGREVLLTFGLLSPNKGVETMIRALPAIVAARPETTYVVLGATHPHLVAREGEAYREGLQALAAELGVAENVRFEDGFVDNDRLMDWLAAADVYVTPYCNAAQITSGTLSYAVALGKPVVSTRYWHAEELLADGRGVLVPFNNVGAFTDAIVQLLIDPQRRAQVSRAAYAKGRETLWPRLAARYMGAFGDAMSKREAARLINLRTPIRRSLPQPSLAGVIRLTDDCGMIQHSVFGVADRSHGYCLDDNARALMVLNRAVAQGADAPGAQRLAETYAAFIQHAWSEHDGCFRNFMGYGRDWLEREGSQDSIGRGFWAVAATAREGLRADLRHWASVLADRILPHLERLHAPRTRAFVALGCIELLGAHPGHERARALLETSAAALIDHFKRFATAEWPWLEPVLSYDNARLPEALIRAGERLRRPDMTAVGLDMLDWLSTVQTAPGGHFRPVGTESFGVRHATPSAFDQQPLEAAATIDACEAAYAATGEHRWLAEAQRAYDWYLGANDLGLRLVHPESGLCYDGLTPVAVNLNQGAESVLSYQWATIAMHRLARAAPQALAQAG